MGKEMDLWRRHLDVVSQFSDPASAVRVDFRSQNSENLRTLNSHHPEITIIIPAFNEEKRIERVLASLNSAISQTSAPTEILVVNNTSKDETANLAKDFGVTVINETLPGIGHARQAGLESSNPNSTFILTTDADCLVPDSWIKNHHMHLKNPDVCFSYGDAKILIDEEISLENRFLFNYFLVGRSIMRLAKKVLLPDHYPVSGQNSGFKRDDAINVGGYKKIAAHEDLYLFQDIKFQTSGEVVHLSSTVLSSARRIIGAGVREYINSRIAFNKKYYMDHKLDKPEEYENYR